MTISRTLATAMCIATGFFAISNRMNAAAPTITYTSSGNFASTPVSGADTLKLAGEPFNVKIVVSAALKPTKTGPNWALYTKLKLTGQVYSALVGSTPVAIASGGASIQQFVTAGQPDKFIMAAPVKVVGISLTITATVILPANTLSKPLLHPFSPVSLTTVDTMLYSDGTNTTTLAIQSGTLGATSPNGTTHGATVAQNTSLPLPAGTEAVQSGAAVALVNRRSLFA